MGKTNMRQYLTRSYWLLPREESCIAPDGVWSNKDMDPTPIEYRTWTGWTFFSYWVCDLFQPGGWATTAAFVGMGLTWWESCLAVLAGSFLSAIVIACNGVVGGTLHVPFAVASRATYGYYGSRFVVIVSVLLQAAGRLPPPTVFRQGQGSTLTRRAAASWAASGCRSTRSRRGST